jgi:hypothetical protein
VLYNQVDACNFKGKRTNGEACGTDAQCTTGHCTLGDSACGVCANQVGAGNSCTDNGDCSSGFVCSDDQHCVLPGAGGTVCTDVQPCKYGFYCRNGSCVTAANSAGATCQDQASSCVFLKGLWCNVSVQTCAAVSYAQPGEPCGQVGSRYAVCSAGSCIYPLGSTEGTCASLGGDGDACGTGTANDKGCQFPSRCVAGHCKKPNSAACQ